MSKGFVVFECVLRSGLADRRCKTRIYIPGKSGSIASGTTKIRIKKKKKSCLDHSTEHVKTLRILV
jgi:hypothetical protein